MARMTYIGLGMMMIVLLVGTAGVSGYVNRFKPVSTQLWIAAAATFFVGMIGCAVVYRVLGQTDPAGAHRLGVDPLAFSAMLLVGSLVVSIVENVSATRHLRSRGYAVRYWLPTWVPVTLWLAAISTVPFIADAVLASDWAAQPMTSTQAEAWAIALFAGMLGLMVAGLVAGAVHVFVLRKRWISRDLAPVFDDIDNGRVVGAIF